MRNRDKASGAPGPPCRFGSWIRRNYPAFGQGLGLKSILETELYGTGLTIRFDFGHDKSEIGCEIIGRIPAIRVQLVNKRAPQIRLARRD